MDLKASIIDCHAHCGIQDRSFDQSFESYYSYTDRHKGIKWHRHAGEPVYNYDSIACKQAIDEIKRRNMPVVYEEELKNTIVFIKELAPEIRVIIPHLGGLNGGYRAIADYGLWERPHVYTDTALASTFEISDYMNRYGDERIMFGSDFPFGENLGVLFGMVFGYEDKSLPVNRLRMHRNPVADCVTFKD